MNICNISYIDIPTCLINVGQSVLDHIGTDGLNWFSAIGPDLSGLPIWSKHAEITRTSRTKFRHVTSLTTPRYMAQ